MREGDRSVLLLFKKGATADTDAIGAIHIAFGIARCDLAAWECWLKEQGITIELRKTWKYDICRLGDREPWGRSVIDLCLFSRGSENNCPSFGWLISLQLADKAFDTAIGSAESMLGHQVLPDGHGVAAAVQAHFDGLTKRLTPR